MPVDSSGSTKPLERPIATQLLHPRVAGTADPHPDVVGLQVVGGRSDVRAQCGLGLVRRAVVARVDVAGADPAEQRDRPDPARVLCGRGGAGTKVRGLTGRYAQRHRAVVGQRVLIGQELLVQRLVDQHAAEAGAVDEQVAVQLAVLLGDDVADPAALVERHVDHVVERRAARRGRCRTSRGSRPAAWRRSGTRRGTGRPVRRESSGTAASRRSPGSPIEQGAVEVAR